MDAPRPEPSVPRSGAINRRRLLHLAGFTGVAAAVAACSSPTENPAKPASSNGSGVAPTPSPPAPQLMDQVPDALATPPLVGASGIMLCRDAWGAQPPLAGGQRHTITQMTLHHSAAVLGDNRNAPSRLQQHQRLHQGRGWFDIAYHVAVDRNGNIYELRDTDYAGDTATDYDPSGHFLVLCEGDFDQETVSEPQLQGAALAFAWAMQEFPIGPDALGAHRDFASTACPGANLYERVVSGELKRRIDELVASGPVALNGVCAEDAATQVAAIQAGAQ